ncbi:MAG: bifunctional 4-hydroxy-2-oxoglutarate aldolase/2-dehydro-3-deoxy-phosphogluconate aldolase [Pseudomonadota bacterium]
MTQANVVASSAVNSAANVTLDKLQTTVRNWIRQPILPVVVVENADAGLRIAGALLEGGLNQIEVTLRTPGSLDAIEAIARIYPDMQLSVGTVRSEEDFRRAKDAGASLFISPGFTATLAQAATDINVSWVPGVATASEVMMAYEAGFRTLKFFPAMAAGGPKALAGLSSALGNDLAFIPTGGVTVNTLSDWKSISSVIAVGGTWLTVGFNESPQASQVLTTRVREALLAWEAA